MTNNANKLLFLFFKRSSFCNITVVSKNTFYFIVIEQVNTHSFHKPVGAIFMQQPELCFNILPGKLKGFPEHVFLLLSVIGMNYGINKNIFSATFCNFISKYFFYRFTLIKYVALLRINIDNVKRILNDEA